MRMAASAVFPIREQGVVRGTLSVYAEHPGVFRDKEIALLEEAANQLSSALDQLLSEEARQRADRCANARPWPTASSGSPAASSRPCRGIFYLYDEQWPILALEPQFRGGLGLFGERDRYHGPVDFFTGDDKQLFAQRIAEVFEKGEASVEASFVTKAGRPSLFLHGAGASSSKGRLAWWAWG